MISSENNKFDFFKSFVGEKVIVLTKNEGEEVSGTLEGYDQYRNLFLKDVTITVENKRTHKLNKMLLKQDSYDSIAI